MTKVDFLSLLRITGIGENAIILAGNAYDMGAEFEREECAKLMDEMAVKDNLTNYYKVSSNAIKARGHKGVVE